MQPMPKRPEKDYHLMIWPALAVILLDQITKFAVLRSLRIHESVEVIADFFSLTHVRNRGMAFGFLNRPDMDFSYYFLVSASIIAICLLLIWFFNLKESDAMTIFAFSLILGGAAGNLIDRLRFREVVDFLDVYVGTWHWPAFNVADSAICVGTALLAFTIFVRQKHL